MILLDGKKTSADLKIEIAASVKQLKEQDKKTPHLAAILVGTDGASMTYVNAKVKACELVGFNSTLIDLPEETSEETLLKEFCEFSGFNDHTVKKFLKHKGLMYDISSEEMDTMLKNGLEPKYVNKYISSKAREMFFNKQKQF